MIKENRPYNMTSADYKHMSAMQKEELLNKVVQLAMHDDYYFKIMMNLLDSLGDTVNEVKQLEKLTGKKVVLKEHSLSLKEKRILDDILSLNEAEGGILDKVRKYAKQGAITAAMLATMMASPKISKADKGAIKQIVSTEQGSGGDSGVYVGQKVKPGTQFNLNITRDWNKYVDWLKSKGLAGDKRMNSVEFSKKTMDAFKKANPGTELDYSHVPDIQQAIKDYRTWSLNKIQSGQVQSTEKVNADGSNYMPWALGTTSDGIVGEYTSQFKFPRTYFIKDDGTKIPKGFNSNITKLDTRSSNDTYAKAQ